MSVIRTTFRNGLIAALGTVLMTAVSSGEAPNLVPNEPGKSANYWCTWYAQNYWIGRGEEITSLSRLSNVNAREELNEHTVFDDREGWAVKLLPQSRCDYFFLIDHGWQVKDKAKRKMGLPFFSLQIDGGDTKYFYSFQAKERFYPELVLEYVTPTGPLNPGWDRADAKEYPSVYVRSKSLSAVLQNTDTFRTYDATPLLVTATTLRRVHDILRRTQNKSFHRSKDADSPNNSS